MKYLALLICLLSVPAYAESAFAYSQIYEGGTVNLDAGSCVFGSWFKHVHIIFKDTKKICFMNNIVSANSVVTIDGIDYKTDKDIADVFNKLCGKKTCNNTYQP